MYNDFSGEDKVKAKITKREYENLSEKLTFFFLNLFKLHFFDYKDMCRKSFLAQKFIYSRCKNAKTN